MTSATDGQPLAGPPSTIERLAFLGTPTEAATVLEALIAADLRIVHVVSQPDRRRGRGSTLSPSPVKEIALRHGLPVGDDPLALADLDIDLAIVVAYGRIIPRTLLEQVPMVNIHFSLLPRWRGAAPVQRAILAGDNETGVAIMALEEGLDTGPVYASATVEIGSEETAADLARRLTELGSDLLIETLRSGLGEPIPQSGEPAYAAKIDRSETRLNLAEPAAQLHRRIRLGRSWATFRSKRLGVEQARLRSTVACPDLEAGALGLSEGAVLLGTVDGGCLELLEVKPEGKRAMPAIDWANGVQPLEGEKLV